MKWFTYFGHAWTRAALGVSLVFDQEDREYAVMLFAGPFLFMCGWERSDAAIEEGSYGEHS